MFSLQATNNIQSTKRRKKNQNLFCPVTPIAQKVPSGHVQAMSKPWPGHRADLMSHFHNFTYFLYIPSANMQTKKVNVNFTTYRGPKNAKSCFEIQQTDNSLVMRIMIIINKPISSHNCSYTRKTKNSHRYTPAGRFAVGECIKGGTNQEILGKIIRTLEVMWRGTYALLNYKTVLISKYPMGRPILLIKMY